MELTLTLPFPPSVNNYKKIGALVQTKKGKIYQQRINTAATMGFYYQVYMRAKQKMPQEWVEIGQNPTIRFEVGVCLHPPTNRLYDIDNRLKVLLDSLVHAHIIKDDAQIYRLYVEKMNIIEQGQVIVRIKEICDAHQ